MADVQIEGLEFDISADSGKASQSLDGLISTLQSLKSAVKGNGLKSLANNLASISHIKISNNTINSINRLADSLKNLSSVSGSASGSSSLSAILSINSSMGYVLTVFMNSGMKSSIVG